MSYMDNTSHVVQYEVVVELDSEFVNEKKAEGWNDNDFEMLVQERARDMIYAGDYEII